MTLTNRQKVDIAIEAANYTYSKKDLGTETTNLALIGTKQAKNGFKGNVYLDKNTGKYVVSFCGTNGLNDIVADVQMTLGEIPNQTFDALDFMNYLLSSDGLGLHISDIELITGHSLGGSLAQIVGQLTKYSNIDVTTLNAFGTANINLSELQMEISQDNSNIDNYISYGDVVSNIAGQIGNSYYLPSSQLQNLYVALAIANGGSVNSIPMWLKAELAAHNGQLNEQLKEHFTQAQHTSPITFIDPIIIDLNNDSKLSTTNIENGTYFDHGNDGFAETSSWVSPNDGILAIDKNNNGYIDNGNEIFGDNYIKSNNQKALNGFDALKDLDTNNDNIINSQDEAFSQIKILKGDGTLLTLQEAGIESINLNTVNKNIISIDFVNDRYNVKYNNNLDNNLNLNVV